MGERLGLILSLTGRGKNIQIQLMCSPGASFASFVRSTVLSGALLSSTLLATVLFAVCGCMSLNSWAAPAQLPESRTYPLESFPTVGIASLPQSFAPDLRDSAAIARHPLGSRENPVRCNGVAGGKDYLARLRCPDGSVPTFRRIGEAGHGPYGTPLDHFLIDCPLDSGGFRVAVFMDFHHNGHVEAQAIAGFTIVKQSRWQKYVDLAMAAFKAGQLRDAEFLADEAVFESILFPDGDERIPKSLNLQGQIFYQTGKFDIAIDAFTQALGHEAEIFGPEHPYLAYTNIWIAKTALELEQMERFSASIHKALSIYHQSKQPADDILAGLRHIVEDLRRKNLEERAEALLARIAQASRD